MSRYNLDMNIPDMCQECGFLIEGDNLVHCVREKECKELKNWITEHDRQNKDKVIDEVISRLLSNYEELDNVMVLDIIEGILEQIKGEQE